MATWWWPLFFRGFNMIEGIFVEGLIFSIMVLGILISYRILDMADMTCDGAVATGAAVCTMCIINGLGITVGMILAFLVCVLCGLVTAAIHNRLHIPVLLAGILTMTMLYSVNLRILGNKANVPLVRAVTLYRLYPKWFPFVSSSWAALFGSMISVALVLAIMTFFFRSDLGVALGAMGGNEQMVISQGMNPATLKYIGLGLGNGLIGISGALLAQYQGFADANLGQGMIVQGLAAIMLGEFLFNTNKVGLICFRAILGGIIYKALMFLGRKYGYLIGITPNDFKLLTGILVIVSLFIAKTRAMYSDNSARKKALLRTMRRKEAELEIVASNEEVPLEKVEDEIVNKGEKNE